jgi:hypothetical protein
LRPSDEPAIPPPAEIPVVAPPRGRAFGPPRSLTIVWVRGVLLGLAAALVVVLGLSLWLNPYDDTGEPRSMATHTQLGLPPCNFVVLTGRPCPACGMTTSFALLAHGDVRNSLKANWVGTLLALYWLALIPWCLISAWKGRAWGVRSGELLTTVSIVGFMALAIGRWVYVIFVK